MSSIETNWRNTLVIPKVPYFIPPFDGSALPSLGANGLYMWFAAHTLDLNDGDSVTTWEQAWNDTGVGFDQATVARKPTFQTNELNGYPVVRFDGVDDYMTSGLSAIQNGTDLPISIFIIMKNLSAPAGNMNVFGYSRISVSDNPHMLIEILGPATVDYRFNRRDDAGVVGAIEGGIPDTTSFHILSFIFTGTAGSMYDNGATVIAGGAMDVGALTITGCALGARVSSASPNGITFWNGDIAELIVLNFALDDDRRRRLERYLALKYGLGAQLS